MRTGWAWAWPGRTVTIHLNYFGPNRTATGSGPEKEERREWRNRWQWRRFQSEQGSEQTATKPKPTTLCRYKFHPTFFRFGFLTSLLFGICCSMETAAIIRSFNGVALPNLFTDKPAASLKAASLSRGLPVGQGFVSSRVRRRGFLVPFVKASETASALTSEAVTSEKNSQDKLGNKTVEKSTFPNGFEALILNVCDATSIAELKLKVGAFEMHLKRDIGNPPVPIVAAPGIASPTTAPPIPSEPMVESASVTQPAVPQKSSSASKSPFANASSSKASKLAALEASGTKSFVLVSSPTVGTFRRGRTLKGKKQPPSCKEGDMIKEGQVIGYLDQFGNELPIRSDAAGEVLKLLFKDGEAVGYGDPLVAILPSFHGINC